jgi:hypothetical protein
VIDAPKNPSTPLYYTLEIDTCFLDITIPKEPPESINILGYLNVPEREVNGEVVRQLQATTN